MCCRSRGPSAPVCAGFGRSARSMRVCGIWFSWPSSLGSQPSRRRGRHRIPLDDTSPARSLVAARLGQPLGRFRGHMGGGAGGSRGEALELLATRHARPQEGHDFSRTQFQPMSGRRSHSQPEAPSGPPLALAPPAEALHPCTPAAHPLPWPRLRAALPLPGAVQGDAGEQLAGAGVQGGRTGCPLHLLAAHWRGRAAGWHPTDAFCLMPRPRPTAEHERYRAAAGLALLHAAGARLWDSGTEHDGLRQQEPGAR